FGMPKSRTEEAHVPLARIVHDDLIAQVDILGEVDATRIIYRPDSHPVGKGEPLILRRGGLHPTLTRILIGLRSCSSRSEGSANPFPDRHGSPGVVDRLPPNACVQLRANITIASEASYQSSPVCCSAPL